MTEMQQSLSKFAGYFGTLDKLEKEQNSVERELLLEDLIDRAKAFGFSVALGSYERWIQMERKGNSSYLAEL